MRLKTRCTNTSPITLKNHDFTKRFPLVVAAVATLPARACLIAAAGGQRVFWVALRWSLGRLSSLSE